MDWAGLEHAYGPAEDVPGLLRALADGDEEALYELFGNIWHQGTVYPATAYAVPFLIRLLDAPGADTAGVLHLLTEIADGHGYHDVHVREPVKRDVPEMREQIAAELDTVTAAHQAVVAGLPSYLRLLAAHPDDEVRSGAAHLIGELGAEVAGGASAGLRTTSVTDRAELVRATAVLALGARGETADDRLADPSPLVRLAAALVLAASDPDAALPGPVVQILERDAPDALDLIERLPAHETGALIWVVRRLAPRWELQVRLITGWLRHTDPEVRGGAAFAAQEPMMAWPPAAELLAGPLADALADPSERVRRWAGRFLPPGGTPAAGVTDRLVAALERDGDPDVLAQLCRARDPRADAFVARRLAAGEYDPLWKSLNLLGPWATASRDVLAAAIDAAPFSAEGTIEGNLRNGMIRAAGRTGVPAAELVPLLRRWIAHHPTPVCLVLADLGPDGAAALPELTALTGPRPARIRRNAARAIWRITGDPTGVLELLREDSGDPQARQLIAELGPVAAEFADRLPPLFDADDYWAPSEAAIAYWKVTGDSAPVVPVLLRYLECNLRGRRAVACLAEIGPEAAAAVPRLRAAVAAPLRQARSAGDADAVREDEEWRAACAAALERIGEHP
ncbi:hypothetical protein GCM10010168_88910 [Actinoplanes ianthinogenes]|uniref:HEAT repeat protein n=1 Tax=Actinoplanes ianthinogenes TaxID=122358 RepID=A0ABM7LQ11_9ACTN|nr:hypothetical protein Aiant_20050 [Actinoplanes ianthinogenes]GGR56265.1 hypothetical protein GCM10010168_88910 [Actinoplanes ianthinogenes]